MKILIEAFALSQERLTGVGYVVLNYVNHLQLLDKDNSYYIYTMDSIKHDIKTSDRWHLVKFENIFSKMRIQARHNWKNGSDNIVGAHVLRTFFLRLKKIFYEFVDEVANTFLLVLYIKRNGINVYIGTSTYYYPLFFVSKVLRSAIVYDLVWKFYPETMELGNRLRMKIFTKLNYKKMNLLISISENTKNDVINLLKIQTKIVSIPLAADKRIFHIANKTQISVVRKKYNIHSNYILSVCTLEPRKNLVSLLKAYEAIELSNEYDLVLVGMVGWKQKELLSALTNVKPKRKIIFTGYVPDADLAGLYSGADLFVYPSLYEGFGLPILEAMQCGCPVLTSTTSSIPEVAGDAAVMVNPNDIEGFAQSINLILGNKKIQTELSRKGVRRAALFSWERSASELLRAIETISVKIN